VSFCHWMRQVDGQLTVSVIRSSPSLSYHTSPRPSPRLPACLSASLSTSRPCARVYIRRRALEALMKIVVVDGGAGVRRPSVGRFACLGAGWKSIAAAAAAASPVGRGCFRLVSHVSACAADGALSPSTPTVLHDSSATTSSTVLHPLSGARALVDNGGAALAWPRLSRPALYRLPLDD